MADYAREKTTWLEAPLTRLFVYRKIYLHSMEVHDCLYGDQGLSPKQLLSVSGPEMRGKGTYTFLVGAKGMIRNRG